VRTFKITYSGGGWEEVELPDDFLLEAFKESRINSVRRVAQLNLRNGSQFLVDLTQVASLQVRPSQTHADYQACGATVLES
jgi:hypothetical protein